MSKNDKMRQIPQHINASSNIIIDTLFFNIHYGSNGGAIYTEIELDLKDIIFLNCSARSAGAVYSTDSINYSHICCQHCCTTTGQQSAFYGEKCKRIEFFIVSFLYCTGLRGEHERYLSSETSISHSLYNTADSINFSECSNRVAMWFVGNLDTPFVAKYIGVFGGYHGCGLYIDGIKEVHFVSQMVMIDVNITISLDFCSPTKVYDSAFFIYVEFCDKRAKFENCITNSETLKGLMKYTDDIGHYGNMIFGEICQGIFVFDNCKPCSECINKRPSVIVRRGLLSSLISVPSISAKRRYLFSKIELFC